MDKNDLAEIWKDVIGYEGKYQVSNLGRVKTTPSIKTRKEKIKKLKLSNSGYLQVVLCQKGQTSMASAHRLVAMCFIPNPENKNQVNHINAIKTDNRVENLEWATRVENMRHAYSLGLIVCKKGEERSDSKLKSIQVLEIREKYSKGKYSMTAIAKEYKVDQSCISRMVNRQTWKHI